MKKNRQNIGVVAQGNYFPSFRELFSMLFTFSLTVLAWIFFRAESLTHAFSYISGIFSPSIFSMPYIIEEESGMHILPKQVLLFLFLFIVIEWFGREGEYAIEKSNKISSKILRWGIYVSIALITLFYAGKGQDFIYFQF